MLDMVRINHVQHISFTQSCLTDAVSVILSGLLSYEHPPKEKDIFGAPAGIRTPDTLLKRQVLCLLSYWGISV